MRCTCEYIYRDVWSVVYVFGGYTYACIHMCVHVWSHVWFVVFMCMCEPSPEEIWVWLSTLDVCSLI
jgi:hypothetical protein